MTTWMLRQSKGSVGSAGNVLIELIFCLSLLLLSFALCVEISRRGAWEILLHHSAFLAIRGTTLGEPTWKRELKSVWSEALGKSWANHFDRYSQFTVDAEGEGKLWYRFPSLIQFQVGRNQKHHFEVTRKCKFPSSSP
jgi:hypothetical protein